MTRHIHSLYIKAHMDGVLVKKVLVDDRAAFNVMPISVLRNLDTTLLDPIPIDVTIIDFAGESQILEDYIDSNGCVPSSLHQQLIFFNRDSIEVVPANPKPFSINSCALEASLVERLLAIKEGFRPYKQSPCKMSNELTLKCYQKWEIILKRLVRTPQPLTTLVEVGRSVERSPLLVVDHPTSVGVAGGPRGLQQPWLILFVDLGGRSVDGDWCLVGNPATFIHSPSNFSLFF
ncbi:hypothetical protein CRG98_009545 [Punica granatum]|uniref:Uncharacterized protein n=1 Tax=Punica granatum TaxID=22663 RepID=A0A2I0KNM6_PUNGR|nr:hypothetical protein CRG98_009545 [Punica granatum]